MFAAERRRKQIVKQFLGASYLNHSAKERSDTSGAGQIPLAILQHLKASNSFETADCGCARIACFVHTNTIIVSCRKERVQEHAVLIEGDDLQR